MFLIIYFQSPVVFEQIGRQVSYFVKNKIFNINNDLEKEIITNEKENNSRTRHITANPPVHADKNKKQARNNADMASNLGSRSSSIRILLPEKNV